MITLFSLLNEPTEHLGIIDYGLSFLSVQNDRDYTELIFYLLFRFSTFPCLMFQVRAFLEHQYVVCMEYIDYSFK
jgi:hypothetical protein